MTYANADPLTVKELRERAPKTALLYLQRAKSLPDRLAQLPLPILAVSAAAAGWVFASLISHHDIPTRPKPLGVISTNKLKPSRPTPTKLPTIPDQTLSGNAQISGEMSPLMQTPMPGIAGATMPESGSPSMGGGGSGDGGGSSSPKKAKTAGPATPTPIGRPVPHIIITPVRPVMPRPEIMPFIHQPMQRTPMGPVVIPHVWGNQDWYFQRYVQPFNPGFGLHPFGNNNFRSYGNNFLHIGGFTPRFQYLMSNGGFHRR